MLTALANLYGRSVESLLAEAGVLRGVRYRCLKSVAEGEKRRFEGQGQAWLEAYSNVEVLLGRQLSNRHPEFRVQRDVTGPALAERVRELYKFGIYPVPSAIRLTENFGIRVIQLETDARIDAFAGWLDDARVVVLNSTLPNDRVRLTILHELAHHLYEDCLDDSRPLDHEEIERRAFEFASHLLIPDSALAAAFGLKSMVRLVQYKERFGISLAAMIYRAGKSGLISKQLYERIWRDFSRMGLNKAEPGRVGADRPVRLEAMMDAAIGQKLASYEQVADWVGVPVSAVKSRVLAAMGGSAGAIDDDQSGAGSFRLQDYR